LGCRLKNAAVYFDEVYAGLLGWENIFEECGVPMEHTTKLRESIKQKRNGLD
jgi:hypothetical protein